MPKLTVTRTDETTAFIQAGFYATRFAAAMCNTGMGRNPGPTPGRQSCTQMSQAEVVPGFRGGYVPAGFHDGSITDGIVTFELEREMWAPMYSRSLRRQRALAAFLGIAVRDHPV